MLSLYVSSLNNSTTISHNHVTQGAGLFVNLLVSEIEIGAINSNP